jgi:hypothetical protein
MVVVAAIVVSAIVAIVTPIAIVVVYKTNNIHHARRIWQVPL